MTLFTKQQAPEGRDTPIETSDLHTITGHSIHHRFLKVMRKLYWVWDASGG